MAIPSLNIGGMTQRLSIQEYADVADGYGGKTRSWSTTKTVWGRVRPLKTDERLYAMQLQGEATHEITIRYTSIDETNRILHNGVAYNIVGPPMDEESRGRKLKIMAKQGMAT